MVHTTVVVLGRNLFEVVRNLPFRGVGSRVKRSRWSEDSFWEITAVKPSLDELHGKAWGKTNMEREIRRFCEDYQWVLEESVESFGTPWYPGLD
eukprot:jgi/Botrbrau1/22315/Bobra.0863s0001.1